MTVMYLQAFLKKYIIISAVWKLNLYALISSTIYYVVDRLCCILLMTFLFLIEIMFTFFPH